MKINVGLTEAALQSLTGEAFFTITFHSTVLHSTGGVFMAVYSLALHVASFTTYALLYAAIDKIRLSNLLPRDGSKDYLVQSQYL